MGVHCTLVGNCVQFEGSAIRLSLIPWFRSLVQPLMVVVENGGKVTDFVVLIKNLFSGCACTSHLDCVAQHTAFQDVERFSGLNLPIYSTAISVIVVPIATGTLC